MKTILISMLLAATYYVSPTGSDTYSGLTTSTPWSSIAKVNSAALQPGDSVLFMRGGGWFATLVPKSGVTYADYGDPTQSMPSICGGNKPMGFVPYATNIYSASWTSTPLSVIIRDNWGHKQTLLANLTDEGDWWYDDAAKLLYVYTTQSPVLKVVVPNRQYCITGNWNGQANNVTFRNLELYGAAQKCLYVNYNNNQWVLDNLVVHHCGSDALNDALAIDIAGNGHLVHNCRVYEAVGNGISLRNASQCMISNCISYNNHHHNYDIKAGGNGDACDDNILCYSLGYVDSNLSKNIVGIGPYINGIGVGCDRPANRTKIYYCVLYDIPLYGIILGNSAYDTEVSNCTIVNSGAGATGYCAFNYYVECPTTTALTLINNIGVNSGIDKNHYDLRVVYPGTFTIDYNCWNITNPPYYANIGSSYYSTFSQTPYDVHSISANPQFNANYSLQSTSPCIDKGTFVSNTVDYLGQVVPQGLSTDIGAVESSINLPPDTVKPVITILGANPMTTKYRSTFIDPGATALDNRDGDITSRILRSGTVNTLRLGTYTLKYNVTDLSGNAADQKSRSVVVRR